MSVTVTFVPLSLMALMAPAAISALASAMSIQTNRREQRKMLDELAVNQACRDDLVRLMFPNLYASRQESDAPGLLNEEECIQAALRDAEPPRAFSRQTVMQDPDFVRQAAESLHGNLLPIAEGVAFLYKDCGFVLFRSETETPYELWILGTAEAETATTLAEEIESEYRRLVQDRVHAALLERSSQYGLSLESEEIQEDNSIVLTFIV